MGITGITAKPLYKLGHSEGRASMRDQVLELLKRKIMDPDLSRSSPRYQALLELTREIAEETK